MKRLLQLLLLATLLSGSVAVLAYIGLPYMPMHVTALRLNSYLYGEAEVLEADFDAEPTVGVRPLAVEFTNTSIGEYSDSRWDFGDGQTSSLDNPLHLYFATGNYTVTLTISGTLGTDTITKTNYIEVHDPLRADFSGEPTSGLTPLNVAFSNESEGEFTACKWDFGDGQISDSCLDSSHEYTSAGEFTVTLTVSSTFDIDTRSRAAYIQAYDELKADFEGEPTVGTRPLSVSFSNLSLGIYNSCYWDFGDGNTSTKCDPSNNYSMKGVYSVTLTVTGPASVDSLTRSSYITVYEPIVVRFKGVPTSGVSPLEVVFSNTSSGDYESCTWNFGDDVISHACHDVVHTYAQPGFYTVTLTASNDIDSDSHTKEAYISVYEAAKADFSAAPLQGERPLKVTFSDQSTGDYSSCAWEFGDGKSSTKCNPQHRYKSSGYFAVILTVSGLGGVDAEVKQNYIKVEMGHLYMPLVALQQGTFDFAGRVAAPKTGVGRIGGR